MFSVFTWKKSFGSKKWCGKRCEGERRFIPSVFYMLSFHAFLKRKTVKRALLHMDNIFSPQLKKTPWLTRTQKFQEFLRKRELNWTFLSIFSKRNIFLHFKATFFLISIWSFEGVQLFWLELAIFYSKLLSATNQQLFLRHWKRYRPSNHIAPLYELLVSVLWLTLSFGKVSKTCRRMH